MDDLTTIDELLDEEPAMERWRQRWFVSCRRWRDGGGCDFFPVVDASGGAVEDPPTERGRGVERAVR